MGKVHLSAPLYISPAGNAIASSSGSPHLATPRAVNPGPALPGRRGVVGLGSRVKTGGMGRGEVEHFRKIPGVRVVALCDVDSANLGPEVEKFARRSEKVAVNADVRKLLENKDIDAVVVTTLNHSLGS
jgi:hypothetical protein